MNNNEVKTAFSQLLDKFEKAITKFTLSQTTDDFNNASNIKKELLDEVKGRDIEIERLRNLLETKEKP
jgi:hypothetical protein